MEDKNILISIGILLLLIAVFASIALFKAKKNFQIHSNAEFFRARKGIGFDNNKNVDKTI